MSFLCEKTKMHSDIEIVRIFRNNRDEGIRILFDRYYRPLVVYADEFMNALEVSEDIVQDFFVRLWKDEYLCNLAPQAISSYLFTSIRNACYTCAHRKDLRKNRMELTDVDIAVETAEEIDGELHEQVMRAIRELPPRTRSVVIRILLRDMKYKEAAEELDISVNTVKTLLRKGLNILREKLKNAHYLLFYIFIVKKITLIHPFSHSLSPTEK